MDFTLIPNSFIFSVICLFCTTSKSILKLFSFYKCCNFLFNFKSARNTKEKIVQTISSEMCQLCSILSRKKNRLIGTLAPLFAFDLFSVFFFRFFLYIYFIPLLCLNLCIICFFLLCLFIKCKNNFCRFCFDFENNILFSGWIFVAQRWQRCVHSDENLGYD